ncbi:sulfatase [Halorussus caseinilyticus]|uniref:sulfatase n=1 Tax=Halorussus caseinilyticus TaxID=3034025 RepID=UPI0023E8A123|nr:sulfatase [Halorussus sp. DT72]
MSQNIILVTYDSLRADHCGFMGYDRDTTPALDALADDGLVFENATASGVPTIASMTSVMTGEHSLASPEIGFNTEQREQVTSRPTIAEVLSDEGYATGALSPNPPASSYFGFDSGFDWFEDFLAEDKGILERAWNRVFQRSIEGGAAATYLRLFRNVVQREEVLRPWEDYYDRIRQWREQAEEPYFLWVLLLEPHHPWLPPKEYRRWSSRWDAYRSFHHYWEMLNSGWTPDFSAREHRRLLNLYDDSIRYGDEFLARLREDFADDDPAIVVHADHGEEFGSHERYGHQPYLTEDLTHVPLVVGNADTEGRVERPVELRSLAPTIADLAGVSHSFEADSLLADDADAKRPWVASKVFAEGERRTAIRTRGSKFVAEPGRRELYDLDSDPDEQTDLAERAPDAADAFEAAVAHHVSSEREKRALRSAADDVAAGGKL